MAGKDVKQILSDFRKAKSVRQLKDKEWHDLDLFDRSEQWDKENIPPWVPKPVTNFIHLIKTTKRAALAIENPVATLRALSPADIEKVEKLQKIYNYEWKRIKCRKNVRDVLTTAKLLGTGIAHMYYDSNTRVMGGKGKRFRGTIVAEEINPANFFPDPNAFRLEDCRFVHISMRKSFSELKKHPIFGKALAKKDDPSASTLDDRGEIFHRDYQGNAHSQDDIIDFHIHYYRTQLEKGGFQYSVKYIAGETEVHYIEDLKPRRYPFAILYDFEQMHDFWGKSSASLVLENQKLVNKVESIIALIGVNLQNPQMIIHKHSGIDPREAAKYGSSPGHVFVSNVPPNMAMQWKQPPQIPQALFNLAEQAKENIREVTGLTQAYMGQSVGSLQTSQGVNALIERSTMRDRDQMYDFELFIEDYSRMLIEFIVEKYNEPRYAITQEDETQPLTEDDFMEYVGTDFKDTEFEIALDVSAKAPISRARRADELNRLLELQGQYGFEPAILTPQEYIKWQDFIDKDQILRRMEQEERQIDVQQAFQVANMMHDAMMQGVPPEEIEQMGLAMIEQMKSPKGIGSANTGQIQRQQAGV